MCLWALADSKEDSECALLVKAGKCSIKGGKIRKVFFLPNGDHWEGNGGNMMMVGNDRGMKQTIRVDRSAAIEQTKHEITALQQELMRNKAEEKGATNTRHQKAWNVAQKEYVKLTSQVKKMEQVLDNLKAEAETSEEVPTIDTSEYESDIKEAEDAVEELKKKEAAVAQEIESLQPGIEEQKKQLDETTARNEKIIDEMEAADAKLEDIVKGQTRRMEQVEKLRSRVQQIEAAANQQEEEVKKLKEKVNDHLRKARQMQFNYNRESRLFNLKKKNKGELPAGEEVELGDPTDEELEEIDPASFEVPQNSQHYKTKCTNKQKKIAKEKERRNMTESDPAVARDKYFRAKKDLDAKMEQIDAIERNTKALGKDLRGRKKRWRDFRAHIAEMTNLGFDEFLNRKGSSGEVEFDHENGQLNLTVQKVSC